MLCCYFCAVIFFFFFKRPHCNFSFEIIKFTLPHLTLPYLNSANLNSWAVPSYQVTHDMLHTMSAMCVAHDLHTIAPRPLERALAAQWGDCKKNLELRLSIWLLLLLLLLSLFIIIILKRGPYFSLRSVCHHAVHNRIRSTDSTMQATNSLQKDTSLFLKYVHQT